LDLLGPSRDRGKHWFELVADLGPEQDLFFPLWPRFLWIFDKANVTVCATPNDYHLATLLYLYHAQVITDVLSSELMKMQY
jgi:hypothetical protein